MARIKLEEIIDDLSAEFRHALTDTIEEVMPEAQVDEQELYQAFKRAIHRKCSPWERVRDSHVELLSNEEKSISP